jgi:hypothetical protein
MNCRQILNEICQKNDMELPKYIYTYISDQKIGHISANVNGIEYQTNGIFNNKKDASEYLAKFILKKIDKTHNQLDRENFSPETPENFNWEDFSRDVPGFDPEPSEEAETKVKSDHKKINILYANSSENSYKELFKILDLIIDKNDSIKTIKLYGFVKKSITDSIVNFTQNIVCENPVNELIWFVAKNCNKLKNAEVHIECNDQSVKDFLYLKLREN